CCVAAVAFNVSSFLSARELPVDPLPDAHGFGISQAGQPQGDSGFLPVDFLLLVPHGLAADAAAARYRVPARDARRDPADADLPGPIPYRMRGGGLLLSLRLSVAR